MELYACPRLGGEVELTDERERHIAERHPDLLPEHKARVGEVLADPDEVRRSERFGNARLFSRWFTDLRGGKHVVVVVVSDAKDEGRHWIITAYMARKLAQRCRMVARLKLRYDRGADILHIDRCPPYAEQESEELDGDVIARLNPETNEVENLEVLFFSTRLLRTELVDLPIDADLRLVGAGTARE